MKNEKIMYIAGLSFMDGGNDDWFIFVASEDCDRLKELKFAYEFEEGKGSFEDVSVLRIYPITCAFDYRAKGEDNGEYKINLIKD